MTTRTIARTNSGRVLELLRARGPMTRADVAHAAHLSVSTVSRLVADMLGSGLLVQSEDGAVTGGRPTRHVRLNAAAATTLAVDIADHHTQVALVGLDGTVLRERTWVPDAAEMTGDARLAHTLDVIEQALTEATAYDAGEHDNPRCLALGVSVPGPVTSAGVVRFSPSLVWDDLPLGDLLRERFGLPVAVANDANLIAIAESRVGDYRDAASLFVLAVFDGIGSGIVVDRALWPGNAGCSGQIGRMLLDSTAIANVYVGYGDLERQLGSVGLARRAADAGIAIRPESDIFAQLFTSTDPAARDLSALVLDQFAAALVNVCALFDPEVIVLAGRFAPLADHLHGELESRLTGRVLSVPRIAPESTGHAGALLGAAHVALDTYGALSQLLD